MNDIVYHYTSLETFEKIVCSKRLRFTNMNALNDKSEYKYGIKLLKDKIIEYEKNNSIYNKFDIGLLDRFSFANSQYSLSFTEDGDSLAFWNSYYVPKLTPISIGFKSKDVFSQGFIINKCLYGNPYPPMGRERYEWFKYIFDRRNILQISKNIEYIHITFQTAHIKQKAFEIEKEWRSVNFKPSGALEGQFERNGKVVKYFDEPFNIGSIIEIIIGPSAEQDLLYYKTASIISTHGLNCSLRKSTIPLEL